VRNQRADNRLGGGHLRHEWPCRVGRSVADRRQSVETIAVAQKPLCSGVD
jgi:hypothetical protein